MRTRKLLTGVALLNRARELGVNTDGDARLRETFSGAQLGLEMIKLFDSTEIRRARRQFSSELLSGKRANEQRVLDFFETLALYQHKGRIDEDTVYSSFSYWIERYWAASREHVAELRKVHGDEGLYADFEELNNETLKLDGAGIPSGATVKRFLIDEASLPK